MLQGPDCFVVVSGKAASVAAVEECVVEAVQVTDYDEQSNHGLLRGTRPLAGILHGASGRIRAAAAASGPVLAIRDTLLWYDWRLQLLHEQSVPGKPRALSVNQRGQACLVSEHRQKLRLRVVAAGATPTLDVELPGERNQLVGCPVAARDGGVFVAFTHLLCEVTDSGQLQSIPRNSKTHAVIASNGILLVPNHRNLTSRAPEDEWRVLWQAPEPIGTAPVLAGNRLWVASATELYALRPCV